MANPELLAKIQAAQPNPDLTIVQAIERYNSGESMQVLAKEMGVSRGTMYNWIIKRSGPEQYKTLKHNALRQRIAEADTELDTAMSDIRELVTNGRQSGEKVRWEEFELARLNITHAKEKCKFTRTDYERVAPDEYGPKQELSVDNKITVVLNKPSTPHIVNGIRSSIETEENINDINGPRV